jgi:hypothetical protein
VSNQKGKAVNPITHYGLKIAVLAGLIATAMYCLHYQDAHAQQAKVDLALKQLDGDATVTRDIDTQHTQRQGKVLLVTLVIGVFSLLWFSNEIARGYKYISGTATTVALLLCMVTCVGCYRPFEPVELQTINTNEEAFLLPFTDDLKKQTSTTNEEYLKANLVYTKQVRIPQQWVPTGFETMVPNGNWKPAALLVKVDKSPVTREWTADENSGTSKKNEAVWVMTADQVEFSTGWTCTARIDTRDNAVKFLHNYPNGSLTNVLDTEVRAKLQATFGLEVTDLPMEKLRKEATPHILSTTKIVTDFFKERGITITNLGITGGFIYKDATIMTTMVRVFNAEQDKAIATAAYQAQIEKNKTVESEAEGKASALLREKQAEADGIKLVADAKSYEISQAGQNSTVYLELKRFEIEREKIKAWDGHQPHFFMGGGDKTPDFLLQVPTAVATTK